MKLPRSILPPVGTGHFRLVPAPVPANFVNFRSIPAGSGRILATGFRHVPCRRRSGEIPTESVSEVVGTSPSKTVPESGPMETVGTQRIRPSLIGTGRNYPTDTDSESGCKEPVGSGRFRPSRNDLGRASLDERYDSISINARSARSSNIALIFIICGQHRSRCLLYVLSHDVSRTMPLNFLLVHL
jgi:hypothetical protein